MKIWQRNISNPIRGLTAERLAQQIDAFTNGYLADFALSAEAMENRDDILKNVITKRKKAVTRHGWEILTENNSPEARQQRDALDYFYRNLTCSHALRKDERGGFQLLAYQMMDAIGKGYAVHELSWKPVVGRAVPSAPPPHTRNHNPTSSRRLHASARETTPNPHSATSESIDVIDLKGSVQAPFSDLVERMDRVMAALWRGFFPAQLSLGFVRTLWTSHAA